MMSREFKQRENYVIKVGTELVPVSREVYEEYHRMERRERYLVERDQENSLILFSTLRAEDDLPDVPIKDDTVNVEEEVIKQMFLDKLPKALALLSDDEKIELLASDGMLVKRPLLVSGNKVLVGFKEAEWETMI